MQKAHHEAVIQNTNVSLVKIRHSEVVYFSIFFSSFATQSVIIVNCIIQSLSQCPALEAYNIGSGGSVYFYNASMTDDYNPNTFNPYPITDDPVVITTSPPFIIIYWLTSTITLGFALHVLTNTVYISVFGQGLGLRGPLGSVVKAADGMAKGQIDVLFAFTCAAFFFGVNVLGMSWTIMEPTAAAICSGIIGIGMIIWYRDIVRIYNKFKLSYKEGIPWEEEERELQRKEDQRGGSMSSDTFFEHTSAPATRGNVNSFDISRGRDHTDLNNKNNYNYNNNYSNENNYNKNEITQTAKSKKSIWYFINHKLSSMTKNINTRRRKADGQLTSPIVPAHDDGTESAITSRYSSGHITAMLNGTWRRVFIVIKHGKLYFYRDKRAFEVDVHDTIRGGRPLDLHMFTLVILSKEPIVTFVITSPSDNIKTEAIEFRCDTTSEAISWIETFNKAFHFKHQRDRTNNRPFIDFDLS